MMFGRRSASLLFTAAILSSTSVRPLSAAAQAPALSIDGLVLVDADSGHDIGPLVNGAVVDLSALSSKNLNVRALVTGVVVGDEIKSVVFSYDHHTRFRVEEGPPYSLTGDRAGKFNRWNATPGAHTITVKLELPPGAQHSAPPPVTVAFTVSATGVRAEPSSAPLPESTSPSAASAPAPDRTLSPSAAPTPESTRTPKPTATPKPTVTPRPTASPHPTSTPSPRPSPTLAAPIGDDGLDDPRASLILPKPSIHLRINAGGPPFVDRQGEVWTSDGGMTTDSSFGDTKAADDIGGTALYLSGRSSASAPLTFRIPVPNGRYRVTFHFMEQHLREPGKRVFDVVGEGKVLFEKLDVIARAGYLKPFDVSADVAVADGSMELQFVPIIGPAMVSGVEVAGR